MYVVIMYMYITILLYFEMNFKIIRFQSKIAFTSFSKYCQYFISFLIISLKNSKILWNFILFLSIIIERFTLIPTLLKLYFI